MERTSLWCAEFGGMISTSARAAFESASSQIRLQYSGEVDGFTAGGVLLSRRRERPKPASFARDLKHDALVGWSAERREMRLANLRVR